MGNEVKRPLTAEDVENSAKQAGAGSIGDAFKSAWLNLKTGLGLSDDEKKKPREQETGDR